MRDLIRDRSLRTADDIVEMATRYVRNGGYEEFANGDPSVLLEAFSKLATLKSRGLTRKEVNDFQQSIWSEVEREHEARKKPHRHQNLISIHEYEEIRRRWGIGHGNRPRMYPRPKTKANDAD